jgi:peptidoglycan-N-acetylglucosamine deacetylase
MVKRFRQRKSAEIIEKETNTMTNHTALEARRIKNFSWPDGKKCAVAIGWHVDGEAGPIANDPRNRSHIAALSMGEYGVSTALPRIIDLHNNLKIPGSFFIPGYVAENNTDLVKLISENGFEVAHHGYCHENVFLLNEDEEKKVFTQGVEIINRIIGKNPVGWSAPGWGVKKSTIQILLDLGMLYDSSLMEYDQPYWITLGDKSLIELPISMILDDYEIYGGSLFPNGGGVNAPAETGYKIWKEEFDGFRRFGGLFSTTFHPEILGRPGRICMLYNLFEYMKSFNDVWWATSEEIALYVQKFHD